MSLIRMTDLTKRYYLGEVEVNALRGVSLSIDEAEFVAITGPSGSGKSTMMHIMGCLDAPTSGSYQLEGMEVADLDDEQLSKIRNARIGFVFQQFNLLARMTAVENVELPLLYNGGHDRRERAIEVLERVGLGDRLNHVPNQLSGGQQQRVAVARALVSNPSLVLADEPTGNLASLQSEELMVLFQQLNDSGITIVMVTHEPDIAQHTKRIVRFRDGHVVGDESVENRLVAADVVKSIPAEV